LIPVGGATFDTTQILQTVKKRAKKIKNFAKFTPHILGKKNFLAHMLTTMQ
jgi:hypothetical protein